MKLTFLGATGTVTGSKYLLEDGQNKILIDCGLFQGVKDWRERNWNPLPVDVSELDVVLLTHAHIDHSGYIPLLVKNGFQGKIYATEATIELCKILLPDSGRLQEEDAERANRYGYSKHKPALPLYTEEDAKIALEYFEAISFARDCHISDFLSFRFSRAGHILGAASIRISDGLTSILFSGDLGRMNDPVMMAPVGVQGADYLVLESTYGDRLHDKADVLDTMEEVINKTAKRGGIIIVPSFAVGRAQLLLYYVHRLKEEKRIPDLPVFLDSPMAIDATHLFQKYHEEHRLNEEQCYKTCSVAKYVHTKEESKALDSLLMPCIIISASGMATGGRVLHHLKSYIEDQKNTILFAGYQAAGTRGASLVNGEKEIIIHGATYQVRAEIANLDNLSAHADYEEIFSWLSHFSQQPRKVFLTHGEDRAATAFKEKIEERLGWNVSVPVFLQEEEI